MRDSDIRYCANQRCSRFEVPIETNVKRCFMCNSKLRGISFDAGDDADTPPPSYVPTYGETLLLSNRRRHQGQGKLLQLESKPAGPPEPLTFDSDCDVKDCSIAPSARVYIPWPLAEQWVYLCKYFHTEWMAYLKGRAVPDKPGEFEIFADGMYFPPQLVSSVHVQPNADIEEQEGTIACVHSHVGMEATFSGEDWTHFSRTVEIVINRRAEATAVVRQQLECGRFTRKLGQIVWRGSDAHSALADALAATMTKAEVRTQQGGEKTRLV